MKQLPYTKYGHSYRGETQPGSHTSNVNKQGTEATQQLALQAHSQRLTKETKWKKSIKTGKTSAGDKSGSGITCYWDHGKSPL